ncbi:hypothetical protein OSB04_031757 [Centaurea solstitialis]|uniref:Integrase catalytic domain-containing protein n=1 Tax=Centaurea solstitialis TaxID=347529 RepID=A0AA38S9L5_9ASTR|nr:hypothetical protein OSB04_031757 [Centaurea solstitialis]
MELFLAGVDPQIFYSLETGPYVPTQTVHVVPGIPATNIELGSGYRLIIYNFGDISPISVQSLGGKKYILVLVDDFSRFTWVEFVRKKSDVPFILINLLKRLLVLHDCRVKVLRSDNETEFNNSMIEAYLSFEGISQNFSAPKTLQQNGVVEKKNITIVETARTMLNASGLPLSFWAEVVSTACYTQNRSLVVKRHEKTPYHIPHGRRPNVKCFHIFGCKCYAIFVGYPWNSVAFKAFILRTKTVVENTNVISDNITKVLKEQAERSEDASISKELKHLFDEWYDDTLSETTRASATAHSAPCGTYSK